MGSAMSSAASVAAASVAVGVGVRLVQSKLKSRWVPEACRAVVVTGCDRGLGFSLALHCRSLGLTVFAGVLDATSPGARRLAQLGPLVRVLPMDVTDGASVQAAALAVKQALVDDPQLKLAALVNNAGVLVFGEFGWQTSRQVSLQLDVNLAGTMRVSSAFLPLLRGQGRLVVVTSHCALAALPGLSVYAATKAGLQAWADALRVEQSQYGVHVVQVIPGSFIHVSGILASQEAHAKEMMENLSQEECDFYGDYPQRFHEYLKQVSSMGKQASEDPTMLPDPVLHRVFEDALLSVHPKHRYIHEPWRYTFYHTLMKVAPVSLKDWLVVRFASLPSFKK